MFCFSVKVHCTLLETCVTTTAWPKLPLPTTFSTLYLFMVGTYSSIVHALQASTKSGKWRAAQHYQRSFALTWFVCTGQPGTCALTPNLLQYITVSDNYTYSRGVSNDTCYRTHTTHTQDVHTMEV